MNLQRRALPLVIAASLGMFGASGAWAQSAAPSTDNAGSSAQPTSVTSAAKKKADKEAALTLATVNVTGNRGSLESAAMRKQLAEQIVDSIVASTSASCPIPTWPTRCSA